MAISLGMHQEVSDASIDLVEREHRRRVWWSVYSMDRYEAHAYHSSSLSIIGFCVSSQGIRSRFMMKTSMLRCRPRLYVSLSLREIILKHSSQGEILTCQQLESYLTILSCLPFWEESDKVSVKLLCLSTCPYMLRNIPKEAQNREWTALVCARDHDRLIELVA